MKITVVAMGKIGLPLAVQFASRGHYVVGTDVNQQTIDLINQGIAPFPGEANLQSKLEGVVRSGRLVATNDTTGSVAESEAVVVVVPLFVDSEGTPDFTWMDAATVSIGKGLKLGTLVSYETTLPVGTTRNRFAKMLQQESGLVAGVDFHLAFSPERVFTGRVFEDLRKYPKLVGGINEASGNAAKNFYEHVLDFDERFDLAKPNGVWDLGSSEASELAKLAETTYRDVNIGLANQFARFAADNGIDVYSVIEACNSQPFSHIHQPGIAVGGHCIPVYPRMYLWNDPGATVVRAAREENESMPNYAVDFLEKHHGSLRDQSVVVLGVSYRGGVKEIAFSGVFPVIDALVSKGASVSVIDPMYSSAEIKDMNLIEHIPGQHADALIIQANHRQFEFIDFSRFGHPRTILDGRNILANNHGDINVIAIGRV
jgi:nucleotide sugar dehydrogenase